MSSLLGVLVVRAAQHMTDGMVEAQQAEPCLSTGELLAGEERCDKIEATVKEYGELVTDSLNKVSDWLSSQW